MGLESGHESVVVTSKVKAAIKGADGMRMAGDFADALNEKVHGLIADAIKRAKANNRSTVKPQDL